MGISAIFSLSEMKANASLTKGVTIQTQTPAKTGSAVLRRQIYKLFSHAFSKKPATRRYGHHGP